MRTSGAAAARQGFGSRGASCALGARAGTRRHGSSLLGATSAALLAAAALSSCADEAGVSRDDRAAGDERGAEREDAGRSPDSSNEPESSSGREGGVRARDAGAGDGEAAGDAAADSDAGSPATEGPAVLSAESLAELGPAGLRMELCPFFTDEALDVVNEPIALCGFASVPLFHEEPERGDLELFIKIIPAKEPDPEARRGALWMLQGGPGIAGATLEGLALTLHEQLPALDLILPDHRGVGRSAFFECAQSLESSGSISGLIAECPAELDAAWGEDTLAFTTTEAARDLVHVAKRFAANTPETLLWGASYGATWAERVLAVDAEGVFDAAVLDSAAVPSDASDLVESMTRTVEAGDNLMNACAEDAECRTRLGDDPKARALQILDNLCEPLAGEYRGRLWFQDLLSGALRNWSTLRLIPALLYRAERCEEDDVRFIERFFRDTVRASDEATHASAPESTALYFNIFFSELFPVPNTEAELELAASESLFADFSSALGLLGGYDVWPTYPRDEYMFELADSDADVLILHGGLDTQTPAKYGRALAEHYTRSNQRYYYFPLGTHAVIGGSHRTERPARFASDDPDERYSCGTHVTLQFLDDPRAEIDASCIDETPPLEFTADDELLIELANHTDPWDNP